MKLFFSVFPQKNATLLVLGSDDGDHLQILYFYKSHYIDSTRYRGICSRLLIVT